MRAADAARLCALGALLPGCPASPAPPERPVERTQSTAPDEMGPGGRSAVLYVASYDGTAWEEDSAALSAAAIEAAHALHGCDFVVDVLAVRSFDEMLADAAGRVARGSSAKLVALLANGSTRGPLLTRHRTGCVVSPASAEAGGGQSPFEIGGTLGPLLIESGSLFFGGCSVGASAPGGEPAFLDEVAFAAGRPAHGALDALSPGASPRAIAAIACEERAPDGFRRALPEGTSEASRCPGLHEPECAAGPCRAPPLPGEVCITGDGPGVTR
jgi:hypothetical protein